MAEIVPFKGILYNTKKIDNMADVVTPPYDVISDQESLDYHNRHPHNIIRLILGNVPETDVHQDHWHKHASNTFDTWLSEDILIQDKQPALYLTALSFGSGIESVTRYGLIGLVRLEPFEKSIVLPHEQTFSKVRSERLSLMKACHANLSPIFSLYSDHNDILETLKSAATVNDPDLDFWDDADQHHRLWRILDAELHKWVSEEMRDKRIFIADGHHRYETALNYQKWLMADEPELPLEHPADYVMMYLSSMEDPGLTILPAHRIIKGVDDRSLASFKERCRPYFRITTFSGRENERGETLSDFMSTLRSHSADNVIGVYRKDNPDFLLLTLKPNVMADKFENALSDALLDLDVVVLTRLIFMEILGFDQKRLDNEKLTHYSSHEDQAIEAVQSGGYDITFLLNPTRIEQVRRVAEQGLIMPRKATYFYPKVITGTVINALTA